MNSLLSMLASRKVKTLLSVHPTPGKSMMGPYSLRHSVLVSVSTVPSARRMSIVVGVARHRHRHAVDEVRGRRRRVERQVVSGHPLAGRHRVGPGDTVGETDADPGQPEQVRAVDVELAGHGELRLGEAQFALPRESAGWRATARPAHLRHGRVRSPSRCSRGCRGRSDRDHRPPARTSTGRLEVTRRRPTGSSAGGCADPM